jgi:hypothetical protein
MAFFCAEKVSAQTEWNGMVAKVNLRRNTRNWVGHLASSATTPVLLTR